MRRRAETVGFDLLHYWNSRGFSFQGQLAFSDFYSVNVSGDSRNRVSWDFGSGHARGITDESWNGEGYADLILKPLVNVRLSFGPSFSRNVEPKQYVAAISDPAASQTDVGTLTLQRDARGSLVSYRIDADASGPTAAFDVGNPTSTFGRCAGLPSTATSLRCFATVP